MTRSQRIGAIATLHISAFFGLAFIVPGAVGPHLPGSFAAFAAYGDFATGVLAILALLTVRVRPLFWLFVVAFNVVGMADLVLNYYHAVRPIARRSRGTGLRDSDHLCAPADDHAYRRVLFPGALDRQAARCVTPLG